MKTLSLILAVTSALLPIISQKTGLSKKYGFPLKMICAFAYLLTGLVSSVSYGKLTDYSLMILVALIMGILGDFFLEYKTKKYYPAGVVFFALGHIVYSITFLCIGEYKAITHLAQAITATVIITALIFIFAKAVLRLKGKKNMLLIYAPVLVFAFVCAVIKAVVAANTGNINFSISLFSGSLLFFFSDIMIGMGKKRPRILHYAVSYTYFAAQALFAISILFQ